VNEGEVNERELFHAVERKHVWTAVVDQIRELIDSGRLAQGERLPSERQLCAQLRVSRVSVREALRVLESVGYVEVRSGSGTYVRRAPSPPGPPDPPGTAGPPSSPLRQWLRVHDTLVAELAELRELAEPGLAGLTATRMDDEAVSRLRAVIEDVRRHLDDAARYISSCMTEEQAPEGPPR